MEPSAERSLKKGVHYVRVALNEIPLFIRRKMVFRLQKQRNVWHLDTKNMQLLGYEGAGIPYMRTIGSIKDYDREENYRVLKK